MTNHVHVLVEPVIAGAALSRRMKVLAARQTRNVNRIEKRSGTLWEGRFKCSIIDTEQYLLACRRCIDLNPVRAAVVGHPADYVWSSYRSITGTESCPRLDVYPVQRALGNDRSNGVAPLPGT